MRTTSHFAALIAVALTTATGAAQSDANDQPALTIYNQQFAVVRHVLPLDLNNGANHVEVTDITDEGQRDAPR